jgi:hypothetical protein
MSKQNSTRPFKGLQTDTSPLDQPKGTYTMAWNAVNETSDGNNNFVSNEQSNELCGQITPGYRPIGDVYISDENTVIFSTNGTLSEIGIIDSDCNYTPIVFGPETTCLNFQITDQIDATFRVRRGCERTIYFTDGINPVRYFNLDKPEEFKNIAGEWECKLFNLFLEFKNPCFIDFEILEQGFLKSGTYSFALQYLDKDLNPTKWTYITQPVPIYNSLLSNPYGEIIGSSNIDTDSLGGSNTATTKSIKLILEDLDDTYFFYRIGIIERTSFTKNVTRTLVSFEVPIQQNEFLYTGNTEGYTEINVNEIRIQPIQIDSAKHIEQLENRLILANTKSKQVNFCSFQQFASQITSKYVVKPAPAEELSSDTGSGTGNSKDPDTYWQSRGYMGDEIYAFGIVYVFEDGYESPAYHIPGIDSTYYDLAGCNTPCVPTIETQNCLRIRENAPSGGSCVGLLTSYTVNYTIDGVPQTYNHTINSISEVRGWVNIECTTGLISNVEVIVNNENCTASVTAFPLYEYIVTTDIPPADVGLWWTIFCPGGLTAPFSPVGISFREKQITTCVAGLPVSPGIGWVLALNDCAGTNTATYVREPLWNETLSCIPPANNNNSVWAYNTSPCVVPGCSVDDIPVGNGISQSWYLMTTAGGVLGFWVDSNAIFPSGLQITSGVSGILKCPNDIIDPWEQNIAHIYPDETAYNLLPSNEKLKNWQIYNTASTLSPTEGYMGYWESSSNTYIDILDCNGNDYWGTDYCGNPLLGTPIRHHKFPDRNLIPHVVNRSTTPRYESTLILQIEFTSDVTDLDALFGIPPALAADNPSLTLTIDYDLDGIAQVAIDYQISYNDFVDDGIGGFLPFEITVVTRIGNGASGIDNLTYSNTIGTDSDTTITNVSLINNEEISPNTDIELNVLGIKFDNVIYPSPDIIGHYIVRGDRDFANRTVIQKGLSNSTHENSAKGINYNLFYYFAGGPTANGSGSGSGVFNQSETINYLFTPSALFQNNPPKGRYIKQEQRFFNISNNGVGNLSTSKEFDNLTEFGAGVGKSAVFGAAYATISSSRKLTYGGLLPAVPDVKLRGIVQSVLLNGLTQDSSFIDNKLIYNLSHTNKVQILELESASIKSDGSRHIPYVSIKTDTEIHPNLFSIQYYRTHNCVLTNATPNTVFGGDTFIAPMNLSNTLFFKFTDSVWDAVLYIAIIIVAVVATVFTAGAASGGVAAGVAALSGAIATSTIGAVASGIIITTIVAGAIGIAAVNIDQVIKSMRQNGLQDLTTDDSEMDVYSSTTKNAMFYANEHIEGIFVETEINLGLRQEHTIYQPGDFFKGGGKDLREYFRDKLVVFDEDAEAAKDQWVHRGLVVPEVYHYNPDYSVFNKDNVYTSLPESYDCCSECVEIFPTRVSYSEQSFQEESVDNFRIFLGNNYRDIEAEKGTITNVFRKHNNLFIHTEEALWQLPQNIQERITGDLISFIGTGSYFSIPPRLINDDDIGSAGSKHKWATIKTDMGVFFIDESNRDIFMMASGQGMKAISNTGLRNFFRQNLFSLLETQYKGLTTNEFLNKNNPANPNGIGYIAVQDTRHERIIFTKKDYKILPDYTSSFIEVESIAGVITGIVNDQLFFDITIRQFGIGTGVDTYDYILLGDPLYFENKSWTLSYSLLTQSWVSFHSYIPSYYYYIHNQFYSFLDNAVWRHNILGSYQNFYGTRYPHIIEYISLSSPVMTRLWDELMLQTIARVYDIVTQEYIDKRFVTFNKAIFYNSRQTSGLLNLIVKDDTNKDYLVQQIMNIAGNQIKLNRDERNWTLNEIRDYRVDYDNSIWSKDWDSIKSEFPIDKVLNSSTIDFDKIWYDLQVLRDKYLIIRLIFDNFDDVNLITNYSFERETPSIR